MILNYMGVNHSDNRQPMSNLFDKIEPKEQRIFKGFRPQVKYADAFNLLVAEQKNAKGKRGTELIDEALNLLLKKYGKRLP